jgi:hypothetical protein
MSGITAEQAVEMIQPGENPSDAYTRIFAHQCKPCDFRRWFSMLKQSKECKEISETVAQDISVLIEEGLDDHAAFLEMYPNYVTHAAFDTAWIRKKRKKPVPVVEEVVEEDAISEDLAINIDAPLV